MISQPEDLEQRLLLAAYTWQGGFDGNVWNSARNWMNVDLGETNQGVPDEDDTVTISGGPNIMLNASVAVGQLNFLASGTDVQLWTSTHTLTVGGGRIEGGWLLGSFVNTGTLVIDVPAEATGFWTGALRMTGSLTNQGTVEVHSGVFVTSYFASGIGNIINEAGAVFEVRDGASVVVEWGQSRLFNSGIVRKAAGPGNATLTTTIVTEPGGTIEVEGGTLTLGGFQQFIGGTIDISETANLTTQLEASQFREVQLTDNLTLTGGGRWVHSQGFVHLNGFTIQSDDTSLELNTKSDIPAHLGHFRTTGTFDLRDFRLVRGNLGQAGFGGSPGGHVFTNVGQITIAPTAADHVRLSGSTLINQGTVTIASLTSGGFNIEGAELDNRSSGIVEFQADAAIQGAFPNGVGASWLKNSGTIIVDSSVTSVTLPGMLFQNSSSGVLDVRGGTLDLSGVRHWSTDRNFQSYSTGGNFVVAPGAVLRLQGLYGSFPSAWPILEGTYTAAGGGSILIGRNNFANAILDFPEGMATWDSSMIVGSVTNRGSLQLTSGTGFDSLQLNGRFINEGYLETTGSMELQVAYLSGHFINRRSGVLELSSGAFFSGNIGASTNLLPLITNEGLIRLESGSATFNPPFDNLGTVDTGGTLTFRTPRSLVRIGPGAFSLPGEWIARDGGQISFPDAMSFFNSLDGRIALIGAGSRITGIDELTTIRGELSLSDGASMNLPASLTNDGRILLSNDGTLSVATNYTQTLRSSLTTLVSGISEFGRLNVAGTVALSGTLITGLQPGFEPTDSDRFNVVTASAVTGLFDTVDVNGLVAIVNPTTVTLGLESAVSDLVVEDVQLLGVSGTLTPGQTFQVQYTVRNLSSNPASGPWTDLLFLSSDSALDARDLKLGRSVPTTSLPAFGSVTLTETLTVPNHPGRSFVIVAADAPGVLFDPNRRNNIRSATTKIQIFATPLPLNQNVVSDAVPGEVVYYELIVPPDTESIQVRTVFPLNDAGELRIRRNLPPINETGDLVAAAVVSGSERVASIDLNNAIPGTYYVAVISRTAGPVTTRADITSLGLTGIANESQLRSQLIAGDTLTLTVLGTGFKSSTQFQLGALAASSVEVLDASTAVVTFSGLVQGGPFLISASDGVTNVTYPGKSFNVIASGTSAQDAWARLPQWNVQISLPEITRPFREIPVIVTFRNDSSISQPAPLLQVVTDNGSFRFVGESDYSETFLLALGVKSTGRPDLYAPGETGSLQLMVNPLVNGWHVFTQVGATAVTEMAVTSQPNIFGTNFPVESPIPLSAQFLNSLRPASISIDAWNHAVSPALASLVGSTMTEWAAAIRRAANVLSRDNVGTRNPSRSIAWLIQQADRFGAIHQRSELTAFGRGIENPFDVRAVADGDGTVRIHSGFGVRPFTVAGSRYVAVAGDRGVLTDRAGGGYLLTEATGIVSAFSADGRWEYTESRLGLRTTAGYTNGRLTTLTDAFGDVTTFTWNGAGRIVAVTDAVGRTTAYNYDGTGERLITVATPTGTTSIEWNPDTTGSRAWTQAAEISEDGVRTEFTYDSLGRLAQRSFAGGVQAVSFNYGSGADIGRVTLTDAVGRSRSWVEGEFGQITEQVDEQGRFTDIQFDKSGRVTAVRTDSRTALLERDSLGNLVSTVTPGGHSTNLEYDATGLYPEGLVDSEGRLTDFVHGDRNLLTEQIDASGRSEFHGYDALGNRLFRRSEGGKWLLDTVNAKNLVTRREYSDGSRQDFVYDAHRNLITVTETLANFAVRTTSFQYDAADRVTRVTHPGGRFVQYRYDAQGRQDQISTSDGLTIDYTFDSLGRLSTVSRNSELQVTYTYDAVGRLQSKLLANGTRTIYDYDGLDRTARIEHRDVSENVIAFNDYTYDSVGRVASMTDAAGTTTYGYDVDGQLIQVTLPDNTVVDYAVDSVGNRTAYSLNELNQYLSGPNGEQYQYDDDGNLISVLRSDGTSTSWAYDGRNRVTSITTGTDLWQFEYDPLGNRSAVIRNGVRTDLLLDVLGGADGLHDVLAEYSGSTMTASYVIGGGLEAAFNAAGSGSYYHFDMTGNTTALTTADGTGSASYRYLPFGEILSAGGSGVAANRYTFNGQWGVAQRGDAGFDMRARVYDSTMGRFTQQDPIGFSGGDANTYRFAVNTPVTLIDPGGLNPLGLIGVSPSAGWTTFGPLAGGLSLTSGGVSPFALGTHSLPQGAIPSVTTTVQGGSVAADLRVSTDLGRIGTQAVGRISPNLPAVYNGPPATGPGSVPANTARQALHGGRALAGLGSGTAIAMGLIATSPLILVAGDMAAKHAEQAEAEKAGPPPKTTAEDTRRMVETQSKQHPSLKTLIDQYRQDNNGQDPPFDSVMRWLQLIRQGERDLQRSEQRTPNDPNEIVGPAGFGTPGYLATPAVFPYTIYFQNQPSALAPAQEVFLTQQLDTDLDWSTFELSRFGWGDTLVDVPAGLKSWQTWVDDEASGLVVHVSAFFNASTGELSWTFRSLDSVTFDLPWDGLAGFLPPDDETGRGQGFVSYLIQPYSDAVNATEYSGQAAIVFDTENPIVTNTWLNTLDLESPTSSVNTLPSVISTASFTVSWSGSDGTGSGIASYDVFVSENNGPYTLWLDDVTTTSASFTGLNGRTYRFYSVATDQIGHTEDVPTTPDATTGILIPSGFTAPAEITPDLAPTFTWDAVPDAVSYEIWIANISTGVNPFHLGTTSTNAYTPSEPLGIGRYRVWRRSIDGSGVPSAWSPQYTFRINAPTVMAPMDRFYPNPRPVVVWDALPGAAVYELWIDNLSTGESKFVYEPTWTETSWTADTDWPLGTYRIWVRGRDGGNLPTSWFSVREILIVTPPTPLSPVNPDFNRQPEFSWSAVAGAVKYEFYLHHLETGTSTWIKDLTDPLWTPPASLAVGRYYWQTLAESAEGRRSLWSAPTRIHIGGRPTLLTPTGSGGSNPVFSWTPVVGVASYELWVDRVGVQAGYIQQSGLAQTSWTPTTALPVGNYRAWVRAISGTAEVSQWSLPVEFTVADSNAVESDEPASSVLLTRVLSDGVTVRPSASEHQQEIQAAWYSEDSVQSVDSIPVAATTQRAVPMKSAAMNRLTGGVTDETVDRDPLEEILLDEVMSLVAVYGA